MANMITSNLFKETVREGIVVVDFFATWCQPCSMLSPVIEALNEEMQGKVEFVKVDVDQSMDIASQYGITNIPALLVFKEGEVQERIVGFQPKEALKEKVEKYL